MADQCKSDLRWWWSDEVDDVAGVVVVEECGVQPERRDSLKLSVTLERARLERALEEVKVRSVVVDVKLSSRSVSGKIVSLSMIT